MKKYYLFKSKLLSSIVTYLKPVSLHNIKKFEKIYSVWANIKMDGLEGDYLEFGILKGKSLMHSYKCSKRLKISNKKFYGFDSFEGFPVENHKFFIGDNFSTNYQKVINTFKKYKNIVIFKGFFSETIKTEEVKNIESIAFAFIDCDIYESSKTIFPFIKERIVSGGFIMIDDFTSIDENGNSIYKAFIENFKIGEDCVLYDIYSNGQIFRII